MSDVKKIDRDQEIVFTNFTDEDFEGQWNKRIYPLVAGKSYYLPFYLAEHFGKHLVDRELNKLVDKEKVNWPGTIDQKERERREQAILGNIGIRQELMDKCVQLTPENAERPNSRVVPMREVPLRTQQRSAELVDKDPGIASSLGATNQPKVAEEDNFEGKE